MLTTKTILGQRRLSDLSEGVDIDVTPVMNMFIILIPFLVSMAVFTHLASHAFTLPGDEGANEAQTAAELPLTVALTTSSVTVIRGDVVLVEVQRTAESQPYGALFDHLQTLHGQWPDVDEVVVAVDDGVVCADIVICLDACRSAGFTEVGLASGANGTADLLEVGP